MFKKVLRKSGFFTSKILIFHHIRHLHQLLHLELLDFLQKSDFFPLYRPPRSPSSSLSSSPAPGFCRKFGFFSLYISSPPTSSSTSSPETTGFSTKIGFFLLIVHLHRLLHPLLRLELLDFAEKGDATPLHKLLPFS
ncbi:uncharacterized protein CELE_F40E3.3 [Caenorhabditis elegans]|uniref:Uncharacterized protein n=1 Tax=Caenorhabditis elegans TaxID=6239 RepID=O01548_CAEEL|nr:Uncharacterized protein CELE_F40E3.3 [Caenorhabditis elegans]CCD70431.1 Uncharacterized protein CELE_F40E3.3 [Caenorhabditis elegans]|eukprot:NP_491017.2 Uncharacterized protein CELE_F40E3.3 [Caenorhabditis elegans]